MGMPLPNYFRQILNICPICIVLERHDLAGYRPDYNRRLYHMLMSAVLTSKHTLSLHSAHVSEIETQIM